jgi:hypothetical protein
LPAPSVAVTVHYSTTAGTGGAHNVTGNPNLVNVVADDYHLAQVRRRLMWGTTVGVTTDVDGDAHPKGNGFDIGYDEYSQWLIYLPLISK